MSGSSRAESERDSGFSGMCGSASLMTNSGHNTKRTAAHRVHFQLQLLIEHCVCSVVYVIVLLMSDVLCSCYVLYVNVTCDVPFICAAEQEPAGNQLHAVNFLNCNVEPFNTFLYNKNKNKYYSIRHQNISERERF